MTEQEFRLTPVDVRTQEFRKVTFGYDKASVEEFRERVAAELERSLKERAILEERLQNSREQLKSLREREKAINDGVMMAQQLRESTQVSAQHEAELIIREARAKADDIIRSLRSSEGDVRRDIETAQQQFRAYVTSFRRLLDRHQSELDTLAKLERDGGPAETP